jgi:antitoxin MazE6
MRYHWSHTETVKVAISLPDQLFLHAEAAAKTRGVSRSQLYAAALADFLQQHQPREITERLNAIYGQKTAKVDRVLNHMQLRALPKEEW